MEKNCYIIGSAISSRTAPEKTLERFYQTLHTIDSINARDKAPDIIVIDTGLGNLPEALTNKFQKNVEFINLADHEKVKEISIESKRQAEILSQRYTLKGKGKDETKVFIDHGYIKSVTESWSIQHLFEIKDLSNYDKIFKISGRYFLNEDFDLNNFNNKFTFKKQAENLKGVDNISSVVWCFQGKYFKEFKAKWSNTINWMLNEWNNKHTVRDLESSIWMGFGNNEEERQITYIDTIGVMGIVNMADGHKKIWSQ